MRSGEVQPTGQVLAGVVRRTLHNDRTPFTTHVTIASAGSLAILVALWLLGLAASGWALTAAYACLATGMGLAMMHHSTRGRRALRGIEQAWQLVRLMDLAGAVATLEGCMATPLCPKPVRAVGLVQLGQIGLLANAPAVAQAAFEAALDRRDVLVSHWLWQGRIGLAEAQLRCEQLADADASISRLRRQGLLEPLRSRLGLLTCLQQLTTGHVDEIVARGAELWREFREHLGTDAGLGYGLLAGAFHRNRQPDLAARHWLEATRLIRSDRLVHRYPVLAEVAASYEACPWPW